MSVESAKVFLEKMKTDEDFAKKVTGCKDSEERRAFLKEAGYSFSAAELKQVSEELSDNELDAVAGGGCIWDSCVDTCGVSELF